MIAPFLTVVLSGQIIYSAFEAFKGSLMLPLQEMLGISQTQYGLLMGYIGIAVFFYVPAGRVNNRFKVRTILFWSLGFRLATYLIIFLFTPSFTILSIVAISWGVLDAIFWPAVVNGVSVLSADDKEGLRHHCASSSRFGRDDLDNPHPFGRGRCCHLPRQVSHPGPRGRARSP